MRVVIIGNGVAGQTVAEEIRKSDQDRQIHIFTEESFPFYSRIFLPNFITEKRSLEKLILKKPEWYEKKNIFLHLNSKVIEINSREKEIRFQKHLSNSDDTGIMSYDKLVIATGSKPRRLPFGNPNVKGVFTLRCIVDAEQIKGYIRSQDVKELMILGGGLLGIELGYNLSELGLKIMICEIAPYLLPRQLDSGTAKLLKEYLEHKGLQIICGEKAEKILGEEHVTGVKFESGNTISCQMVLQQMGIIPKTKLAENAGLEVERGIVVNDFMQTSEEDIYAAGDCIQFNGSIWGIIPACLEQAKIAAKSIINIEQDPYQGTFWSTRLKVAGLNLSCFGKLLSTENLSDGKIIIENTDAEKFISKKVLIEEKKLQGGIIMGPSNSISGSDRFFLQNLGLEIDEEQLKKELFLKR
ncbi:MAG: hypothetical protein DRO88_04435 [Promethearchaeia archaeon]|nr:MAG: hypothetical protein DRO88_04435 [Candidatus Lokiarchaeia archaeon]